MRSLTTLLMLALLAAPVALAQADDADKTNETSDRPDDAAWVEDCPPDMMCAAGGSEEPQQYGEEGCIECSGPVDDGPGRVGPDDCIDCFQAPGETCMDGASENETCRDDVYYMDGPTRGPSDGSCENCRGEEITPPDAESHAGQVDVKNAVPLPAALVIIGVASALVFVAMRR